MEVHSSIVVTRRDEIIDEGHVEEIDRLRAVLDRPRLPSRCPASLPARKASARRSTAPNGEGLVVTRYLQWSATTPRGIAVMGTVNAAIASVATAVSGSSVGNRPCCRDDRKPDAAAERGR
jgi:hypothetical protein